ncbi:MAG: Uma2 family endonuclease, partial [Acidobacteria bacterium]|nr:Uma2 family endonuclease [Acidobacteriota bacterium]
MSAFPIPRITPEEYFALDDASEQRLEYHDGEVFPIADVTFAHSVLQANLLRAIGNRLDGTPCRAISTMRVRVSPTKYVQPDLIVFCGKPELNKPPDNSLTNPKVICEVLSPST